MRLSGDKMAVRLAAFLCKFSKGLLIIVVNNNLGGESIHLYVSQLLYLASEESESDSSLEELLLELHLFLEDLNGSS